MHKRLILFELNEFNDALLKEAADTFELTHVKRLLALPHSVTATEDTYDSDYLEPWVQWVSLHTGIPAAKHRVKHLGDVPELAFPQLWEVLAERGVTTGVWGVLNGSRGRHTENNLFFVPDPWTFSEVAHPKELNRLLALPRYLATNRARFSPTKLVTHGLSLLRALTDPKVLPQFSTWASWAAWNTLRDRSAYAGYCFVEYLSGLLFLEYFRRYQPQFGVFFVNSIAHVQHYYWEDKPLADNRKLRYAFRFLDRLVGALLDEAERSGAHVVVTNALSQKNTTQEPAWISYRPKDHAKFLQFAGLDIQSVEPLMSYDALIFFPSADACRAGKAILEAAQVNDRRLFLVETYPDNAQKLFYRFQFTDPVDPEAPCTINDKRFAFGSQFQRITQRTGKHIPKGDVYSSVRFATKRPNHQVFDEILGYFAESVVGSALENHR